MDMIPKGALGGMGKTKQYSEEEEAAQTHKITSYINDMDEELRDRFKALQMITMDIQKFDDEEQAQIKELELEYENKYKQIYA